MGIGKQRRLGFAWFHSDLKINCPLANLSPDSALRLRTPYRIHDIRQRLIIIQQESKLLLNDDILFHSYSPLTRTTRYSLLKFQLIAQRCISV